MVTFESGEMEMVSIVGGVFDTEVETEEDTSTDEESITEEFSAHGINDEPSDASTVLKRTGDGCQVREENKREMIEEVLHLNRVLAKLKGQATEPKQNVQGMVRLKEQLWQVVRRKEELWQLISAANCAEEQRTDPERANLCSRGEEHNDTAAVAAGSPNPTRKPALLAVENHRERPIRRRPSEFDASAAAAAAAAAASATHRWPSHHKHVSGRGCLCEHLCFHGRC